MISRIKIATLFAAISTATVTALSPVHESAKADDWNPDAMVMPSIDHIEAGNACDGVDVEKKRLYLNEWGKAPYLLLGEEIEISPRWSGMTGRSILVRLQNGNEVYIDKACLIPNPLSYYRKR